jgi:hypothetical protein
MYILVLIISLKSQFNHALDIKYQDNLSSERICHDLAEETITGLKSYNKDVETKYFCKLNATR